MLTLYKSSRATEHLAVFLNHNVMFPETYEMISLRDFSSRS